MGAPKHQGPSPSEQALFKVWDRIEAERLRSGETAATKLAQRALRAVEPPKGEKADERKF